MRGSRLVMAALSCAFALALVPSAALGYTLYGASHETTRNAYGNYYAGQDRCTGAMCHTAIVNQPTVHSSFVTDVPANPSALSPSPTGPLWPSPFPGVKVGASDIFLQLGVVYGPHEYVSSAETTLATVNPSDDLRLWSGLEYEPGQPAWDSATSVSASAYSQSCGGCHNLGVTRPSNATYALANGGTETTSTPSGAFGLGIQCEVCHGSGKNPGAHAPGIPSVVGGTQILKAQVCGQCHVTATAPQKNVAGSAFGNANGYTTDATLSAYLTPTTAIPTEAQFMSYITSGGAKPAFLPNGDDYSLRHDYYNEWLNNLAPSSHGGSFGHANPTNNAVVAQGDSKCLACHSGLGFLQRIGATTPLGSLIVTDAPTLAQVQSSDPGISCQVCHSGHVGFNATNTDADAMRKWGNGRSVTCGDCHNWQFEVLGQAVQTEVIGGVRYARPAANARASHPQREMFSGGQGGANGNGGMWGVAPMGEFMPGQTCQDCHMPRTSREGMPANDDGGTSNTRASHRFHVTMPGDAARYKLRPGGDSCTATGCHTGSAADYTRADFQQWIDTIQSGTQRQVDEATSALSAVSTRLGMSGSYSDFVAAQPATVTAPTPAEWEMLQKAAQNAGFVNADSSKGVHQPQYAAAGLKVALMWARSYDASLTASEQPRIDGADGVNVTGSLLGNDGHALVGATVLLEASTDGGSTWTTADSKHLSTSAFTFATGPVMGDTLYRCTYSPDAGVVYHSSPMAVSVPFTSITLAPSIAATGWVDAPVRVTLSTPATGAITMFSMSGATEGASAVYTGPFWVSANGRTTVTYWSTSGTGSEVARAQVIAIDRTTPVVTSDASTLYLADAAVHLTASDSFSGPAYLEYALDGSGWTRVDGAHATVSASALGGHVLRARATNNLGHTGAERDWSFSVKRATALSVSPKVGSVTLKRGGSWSTSAVVRTGDGTAIAGKLVALQRSTNGSSWTTVATRTTSKSGSVSRSTKMTAKGRTYWRWLVVGDARYLASVGPRLTVVVK